MKMYEAASLALLSIANVSARTGLTSFALKNSPPRMAKTLFLLCYTSLSLSFRRPLDLLRTTLSSLASESSILSLRSPSSSHMSLTVALISTISLTTVVSFKTPSSKYLARRSRLNNFQGKVTVWTHSLSQGNH